MSLTYEISGWTPAAFPATRIGLVQKSPRGRMIAGAEAAPDIPSDEYLEEEPEEYLEQPINGGFGKKLKKAHKKFRKANVKVLRKAAPVIGVAANLIPGVGTAVSAAILAGVAIDKRNQQKKRAKKAQAEFDASEKAYLDSLETSQNPQAVINPAEQKQLAFSGGSGTPSDLGLTNESGGINFRSPVVLGAAALAALLLLR